jgi:hypothetical protein
VADVFHLIHPHDPTTRAAYGRDPQRGVFVDVSYAGMTLPYDAAQGHYDMMQPVLGALGFMAQFGLVGWSDVEAALRRLVRAPELGHRRPRKGVRRALRVLSDFRLVVGR